MGNLKPGASYIYEQANGITYAREVGTDPSTRFEIGRQLNSSSVLGSFSKEDTLWRDIRKLAETNETLKSELDRVIMLYWLLEKQQKEEVAWHRV